MGEEKVGLDVTVNPLSFAPMPLSSSLARLPLKDRFLLSFSLICQVVGRRPKMELVNVLITIYSERNSFTVSGLYNANQVNM